MEIKGTVHCLFEQSGTFKNEFRKLGYRACDYDIQNEFGQTDYVIDLFEQIKRGYREEASVFDKINRNDLILAFFPCIYFCADSMLAMTTKYINYRKLTFRGMADKILERSEKRQYFYEMLVKLFSIVKIRGLRMIVENPWTQPGFLNNNFLYQPTMIDRNRMLRGDYYKKPTAYWFVGCEPTYGKTYQYDKQPRAIRTTRGASQAGICSAERSMISRDYARNFICDFIIGKKQNITEPKLF